ncbi:MAG: fasciclin domain-containing protein [Gammaproteobacteria bacterium]
MLPTLTNAGGYVSDAAKEQNIIETAQDAGSFETLLAAIDAAGLTETLAEGGPFTVFAPTDAAFARIPQETLDALLKDKQALAKVLTYHVVAGEVRASEVVRLSSATTVEGSTLAIDTGSGVRIDDANVVATDITASNGVIHVIDKVLIP